jgi:hypothetical protein
MTVTDTEIELMLYVTNDGLMFLMPNEGLEMETDNTPSNHRQRSCSRS